MPSATTAYGKYNMKTLLRKRYFLKKNKVGRPFKKKPERYTRRRRKRYNINTNRYRKPCNQISPILNKAADEDKQISPKLSEVTEQETPSVLQKITQRLINNYPNPENASNVLYPCGLINRSNYCYVNATMQALLACPLVYNLFFDIATYFKTTNELGPKTPTTICKMAFLVYAFYCQGKDKTEQNDFATPFEANWMYNILQDNATYFFQDEQQDAEEFFSCLINKLNDEMVDLVKTARNGIPETATQNENIKTPITDIFGGLLKFNTYRQNEETSSNVQSFFTLPLDLKNSSTIFESFKALTAITKLEGIVCSKTNKEIEANQQTLIENLPKVLVCQVKCFEYDLDGPKKIQKQLEFPLNFEIDSEMLASNREKQQRTYKLFAVVYHKGGSITRGHYIAKTYNEIARSWIEFNDEYANLISEDQVLKPEQVLTPYLLFYQSCGEINDVQ